MRIIHTSVESMENVFLPLGVQNEHHATQVRIDYRAWVESGDIGYPVLEIASPDGETYSIQTPDIEDTTLIWNVSDEDTAEVGEGKVRVYLKTLDGRIKSAASRTVVSPSLGLDKDTKPEKFNDWLDELADRVSEASADAVESVAAKERSVEAADRAENAAALVEALSEEIVAGVTRDVETIDAVYTVVLQKKDWRWKDGMYRIDKTVSLSTPECAAYVNVDESAIHMEDCIEVDTMDGKVQFSTAIIPTGDISGTMMLIGKKAGVLKEKEILDRLDALEKKE